MKVSLIKPQGFCSGVTKAVSIAKKAKEENPNKKIYILGMLAHNKTLIDDLSKEGFITLSDVNEEESIKSLCNISLKCDKDTFSSSSDNEPPALPDKDKSDIGFINPVLDFL